MICKHCGKSVELGQKACPHCGHALESSEKGNGFWDMAAPPKPNAQPIAEQKPVTASTNTPKSSSKKAIPLLIAVGALAICSIVLSVVLFAISNKRIDQNKKDLTTSISYTRENLNQSISSMKQSTDEQVNAMSASFDEKVTSLSGSVDSLRSDMAQEKKAEPAILCIISSPANQEENEGYTNDEGTCLFVVEIQGPVTSFKWEKRSPSGEWTAIEFDSTLTNSVFGLMLQEDASQGYSRLIATGLTLDAMGEYKCIVTIDGFEKELFAYLTVRETDPAPESSPESDESEDDNSNLNGGGDDSNE